MLDAMSTHNLVADMVTLPQSTPGTYQIDKAVSGILTHKTILTLMGGVGGSNQQTSSVASHRPRLDPQRSETWYVQAPAHYKCSLAPQSLREAAGQQCLKLNFA